MQGMALSGEGRSGSGRPHLSIPAPARAHLRLCDEGRDNDRRRFIRHVNTSCLPPTAYPHVYHYPHLYHLLPCSGLP